MAGDVGREERGPSAGAPGRWKARRCRTGRGRAVGRPAKSPGARVAFASDVIVHETVSRLEKPAATYVDDLSARVQGERTARRGRGARRREVRIAAGGVRERRVGDAAGSAVIGADSEGGARLF